MPSKEEGDGCSESKLEILCAPKENDGHGQSNEVKKTSKFECHICLDTPQEPVVTKCGHLYCWGCLHSWLKPGGAGCPVCKSGVTVDSVIPIYGAAGNDTDPRSKHRDTPERPRAAATPSQPPRAPDTTATSGFSIGVFPFGLYVSGTTNTPLSRDEQINKLLAYIFLILGIAVAFWTIFNGSRV